MIFSMMVPINHPAGAKRPRHRRGCVESRNQMAGPGLWSAGGLTRNDMRLRHAAHCHLCMGYILSLALFAAAYSFIPV